MASDLVTPAITRPAPVASVSLPIGHIGGLDGLRAFSILVVILSHAGVRHVLPGGFGVTVFFFISGYLITTLLMKEQHRNGRIDLPRFFMRRVLRLVPASLLFVLCGTALMYWAGGRPRAEEPWVAMFYLANYYEIFVRFTPVPGTHLSPYNVLWSLAVEEHFYLLAAPLFALAFARRFKVYVVIVVMAIVAPLVIRILYGLAHLAEIESQIYTFAATECRLDSIAYGVLVAVLLRNERWRERLMSWRAIAAGFLLLLLSFLLRDPVFRETLRYSIQGIGLSLLVPSLISGQRLMTLRKVLNNSVAVWIGQLSYSLYLFHWIALMVTTLWFGPSPYSIAWQCAFWALTLCLSALSYYGVEQRFLRLRARYGSVA